MGADIRKQMLETLRGNVGFTDPDRWIEYGIRHGLRPVAAERVPNCPECGGRSDRTFGQFVYYSTLVRLVSCADCGLVWTDARIPASLVYQHFEGAYKDEQYFSVARGAIFRQMADLVARVTPAGGHVLDIGGATGEFLSVLRRVRPDLNLTLNDLSPTACSAAADRLGIATHAGDIRSLAKTGGTFDTVICSDVLYYEPDIRHMWPSLAALTKPGGTVCIRVPNKYWLIRAGAISARTLFGETRARLGASLRFFNPEHLYILRRKYLARRLAANGFGQIVAYPSRALHGSRIASLVDQIIFRSAQLMWLASARSVVTTPSMILTAVRKP